MDPKNQQYDGKGDYTPSGRASKAVSHAKSGGGGNGLVGDGPSNSQSFSSKSGDGVKQRNEMPAQQGLNGSDKLDNARSVTER